jgi:hypothetical protein
MRKALDVIKAHPFWFAGLMARRMAGMLKYAGEPVPYMGTAGINVTSGKCLPESWRGGVVAAGVNLLGMLQSVVRYLLLPLILLGIYLALRRDIRAGAIILTGVLYYLIVGSILHTELRYGLPMQALLIVFAGVATSHLAEFVRRPRGREPGGKELKAES